MEALEEALIAEGGAAAGRCVPRFVWTWAGLGRETGLDCEGMVLPRPNAWGAEEGVESVFLLLMTCVVGR